MLGVARAANSRLPGRMRRTDPDLAVPDTEGLFPVATYPRSATRDWWRTATAVAAGGVAAGVVLFLLGRLMRWLLLRALLEELLGAR